MASQKKEYDHRSIEKKWQKQWAKAKLYATQETSDKPKFYCLDMFPYPSGDGLHVGHPKGYIATDVMSRFKMLNGFNVLHPMGWDAFGLPAENYALKHKVHPRVAVETNIKRFKEQLGQIGFTYDWEREVNTTDPEYYKWTQWIFLQLFKKGLAYESYEPINWCPSCQTGLANEDLEDGKCERCGSEVEKKPMRQWVLKMTAYADRLLDDLQLLDWEPEIVEQQRNWIGRSEGAEIEFGIKNSELSIKVFTTRPDTIFGATYMVMAPEHFLIEKLKNEIQNWEEVEAYVRKAKNKSDLERTALSKEKTGVELQGLKAVNPANNAEIPVFVADYVLGSYGTGAIMAVPAHDERDWEFAKKYGLKIKMVIVPSVFDDREENGLEVVYTKKKIIGKPTRTLEKQLEEKFKNALPFTANGILINSGDLFSGLRSSNIDQEDIARKKIIGWLENKKLGGKIINYKMRDWVFSRQRYWGEPIPIVHCEKCGTVAVPEKDLPVRLPEVERYEPTGTGESPLAAITDWVNTTCPQCSGPAKRETNTMPQWAGSCWYYLRYMDNKNKESLVSPEREQYWGQVDQYVGGAEHATRHLLYARFWHKFLYDIGAVTTVEPFKKLFHVGLILAEDGKKMSKRWGNVINPDDIVEQYGADSLRLYEMFMGPFSQAIAWNTKGLVGVRRFLDKIWNISRENIIHKKATTTDKAVLNQLHKTIKKVTEDIGNFRFNTAISSMMILVNALIDQENNAMTAADFEKLLQILSPFAPHVTEEIWSQLGHKESIFQSKWPTHDPKLAQDEEIEIVVQINGKVRSKLLVVPDISEAKILKQAHADASVQKWLDGKKMIKEIYVPGKIISIVVQ